MPGPRKWPTDASDDRDDAADNINQAAIRLVAVKKKTPPEISVEIGEAIIQLQYSLRCLERQGAPTRPPGEKRKQFALM